MNYAKLIIFFFKKITSPISQILMLSLTLLLAVAIAYRPYVDFDPLEKSPELYDVSPQLIRELRAEPATVSAGLQINDFPEFDIIENKFTFSGFVWFLFDPSQISLDTIDKFSFEKGTILNKSEPDTRLEGGNMFVRYIIRVEFKTDLDFQSFPLDDHNIYISLVNKFVTPGDFIFEASVRNLNISSHIQFSGWKLVAREVNVGFAQSQLTYKTEKEYERYPKIIFTIGIKKYNIQGIILVFLPLFLVCFIALFALAFDPETQGRVILSLSSTGVASLVAYRFVIQSISPTVGYFMLSDQIFILFLAFLFAVFTFSIVLISYQKLTDGLAIIRGIVFLLFHFAFLAWWYYLLYWWV